MENHLKRKLEEMTTRHRQSMDAELIEVRRKKRELQGAIEDLDVKRAATNSNRRRSTVRVAAAPDTGESGQQLEAIRRLSQMPVPSSSSPSTSAAGQRTTNAVKEFRGNLKEGAPPPAAETKDNRQEEESGKNSREQSIRAQKDDDVHPFANEEGGGGEARRRSVFDVPVAADMTRKLASRRASAASMRRGSSVYYLQGGRGADADPDASIQRMEEASAHLSRVVQLYEESRSDDAMRSADEKIQEAQTSMHKHYAQQFAALELEVAEREKTIRSAWASEVTALKSQLSAKTELVRQQHKQLDAAEHGVLIEKKARELSEQENTKLVSALAELQTALELDSSGNHRTLCNSCHQELYRTAVSLTYKYSTAKKADGGGGHPSNCLSFGGDQQQAAKSHQGTLGPKPVWTRGSRGNLSFGDLSPAVPSMVAIKPFSPGYQQDRIQTPFSPDTARLRVQVAREDPCVEPTASPRRPKTAKD
jgi:hypothetical protein